MNFNKHSQIEGQHAFLSASKYHWINYDEEKLAETYSKHMATLRGTELHDFARQCIHLGVRLPKAQRTLNLYVNDAIGFKMTPEQPLYYSPNCFGTADAITFKRDILRIHDLKTGSTPASMSQLEVYAALFCLEYDFKPDEIGMELRIYQSDQVFVHDPDRKDISSIMNKIVIFDKRIEAMKLEV